MEEDIIKKSNKTKTMIYVVLLVIILICLGYFCYKIFAKKSDAVDDSKVDNIKEQDKISDNRTTDEYEEHNVSSSEINDEKKLENYLIVYKSKDYDYLCLDSYQCANSNEYKEAFKILVSNSNAKLLAVDVNNMFVLYNDNGIKIYDIQKNSIQETELKYIYKNYELFVSENNSKVIGVGFKDNNDYIGYYNVSLKKTLYTKKYKNESIPYMNQVNDNYISVTSGDKVYLLSINSENIVLSYNVNDGVSDEYGYSSYGSNGNYIYSLNTCFEECEIIKFYNNNFKEFYSNSIYENNFTFFNNNLYINEDNYVNKYDINGNLVSTSKSYYNIKKMEDKYVIYIKDDNLILENIVDETEFKELTSWKEQWFIDFAKYYTRKELDYMGENNKKEGFYVVVDYDSKETNGYYGMEYCYTSNKEIVEYPITEEVGGRAKPVLYLYPKRAMKIKVKFTHPEYLTTSYPKYNDLWEVYSKPNGDLYDNDGKYYYALYWDEKRYHEVPFNEGFYVTKEDAIVFLEEKLSIIGLNGRERNEFIMYWLPILEKNEKSLVYFELTKEREMSNKLVISPQPDSILRVSIHIKKVDRELKIKEEKLETFNRKGFAVVEWGGMVY